MAWGRCAEASHLLASASAVRRGTSCGLVSSVDRCRDGFDLDELIRIAENSDTHERARYVVWTEGIAVDRPSVDEVALLGGCDENACAQDITEFGPCRSQSSNEVLHRFAGLRCIVSNSSRAAIEVQRADAGAEDEARLSGSRGGGGILRNVGKVS